MWRTACDIHESVQWLRCIPLVATFWVQHAGLHQIARPPDALGSLAKGLLCHSAMLYILAMQKRRVPEKVPWPYGLKGNCCHAWWSLLGENISSSFAHGGNLQSQIICRDRSVIGVFVLKAWNSSASQRSLNAATVYDIDWQTSPQWKPSLIGDLATFMRQLCRVSLAGYAC